MWHVFHGEHKPAVSKEDLDSTLDIHLGGLYTDLTYLTQVLHAFGIIAPTLLSLSFMQTVFLLFCLLSVL
jgi:hypothetical protein